MQTQESLDELLKLFSRGACVSLDTEADSLHHYHEKVCLIQLSIDRQNFIVDPLAEINVPSLLEVLRNCRLVVHGGEYDLRMLRASFDYEHKSDVFDTMLAAQILGYERLGLVNLVEDILGINLSKKGRKSDWSNRPLTENQLAYACDDTRYLDRISGHLSEELKKLGRLEWHQESCQRMMAQTREVKPPADPERAWRIKGHRTLRPRQLAVLRSIWHWREQNACDADLPPFKIIGNATLIEICKWATGGDFHKGSGPKLPRNINGHRRDDLLKAVDEGLKLPESDLPRHYVGRYDPSADRKLVDALKAECTQIAREHNIETSVIAPRSMLEAIVVSGARTVEQILASTSAMKWQARLIVPAVVCVLGPG